MSVDLIRYDLLAQEALRGVVQRVLEDVARTGVPGEHHFYISFLTAHPGVRISSRLREKYPEEMTIILQHQFWDLSVTENVFDVGLSFGGVPEMLHVPFEAVTGFFDPSVKFGLKFEPKGSEDAATAESAGPGAHIHEIPRPDDADDEAGGDKDAAAAAPEGEDKPAAATGNGEGAEIVSLDKFRRK